MYRRLNVFPFVAATSATIAITAIFWAQAIAAESAAGMWEMRDHEDRPTAWILIEEKDGLFDGRLVRLFPQPDALHKQTCDQCPGKFKKATILGITILSDLTRDGDKYTDGKFMSLLDGSFYKFELKVVKDGSELLAIPPQFVHAGFGELTHTWYRLPDNVIAPQDIPKENLAHD